MNGLMKEIELAKEHLKTEGLNKLCFLELEGCSSRIQNGDTEDDHPLN